MVRCLNQRRARGSRRGIATIYFVMTFVALVGFVSLATDYAHVQLAKTQLETATDAACRYGAKYLALGQATVLAKAQAVATENSVNGAPLALTSADVTLGKWNTTTKVFTANATPANAVRVTGKLAAARGTGVGLLFGSLIGRSTCDVNAVAVYTSISYGNIVGLDGIQFKNQAFVGGYNPSVTTSPTHATSTSNGSVASNGYIGDQNNTTINGLVVNGPGGSVDPMFSVSNGTFALSTALTPPPDPAWTPVANPGGVPQSYTHGTNSPLLGGTYWFTSLTVNKPMTFLGPATIYIKGNVDQNDDIDAYQMIPQNLKIYQIGSYRWDCKSNHDLCATITGPYSIFEAHNSVDIYGTLYFKRIICNNTVSIYGDDSNISTVVAKLVK